MSFRGVDSLIRFLKDLMHTCLHDLCVCVRPALCISQTVKCSMLTVKMQCESSGCFLCSKTSFIYFFLLTYEKNDATFNVSVIIMKLQSAQLEEVKSGGEKVCDGRKLREEVGSDGGVSKDRFFSLYTGFYELSSDHSRADGSYVRFFCRSMIISCHRANGFSA